ncbi:MAG TPA: DUF504 domain-containing protein [Thermoplasmatales archaeon]|nr:MAG: DUF504 domain-containing protein [Thermoplasmata archaeon]RLF53994.1 MAG: DUF504 domain-containing protein [Thermoplasmata archaeon]HDN51274.1 DUF504 domain-containing protein [Thermoplasmatales archaeon]
MTVKLLMNTVSLLNKLKWDSRYDFSKVRVWYVSRGEPDDMAFVDGDDIHVIGRAFLETARGYVPHHRIVKIEYEGQEIFRLSS